MVMGLLDSVASISGRSSESVGRQRQSCRGSFRSVCSELTSASSCRLWMSILVETGSGKRCLRKWTKLCIGVTSIDLTLRI